MQKLHCRRSIGEASDSVLRTLMRTNSVRVWPGSACAAMSRYCKALHPYTDQRTAMSSKGCMEHQHD